MPHPSAIENLDPQRKLVVGMVHLPPLPGAPRCRGDLAELRRRALADAEVLAAAGVDAVMLENFGDVPFHPGRVPAHVVAHMTAIASDIRARFPDLPLGINVLRNDGESALSIAHAVGAAFIRVNVLCGARLTDQGLIQGIAHELMRLRSMLDADRIRVWADVDVKHSAPLAARPLEEEVRETVERGLADAIIVSGSATGQATDLQQVAAARKATSAPILIGSGVTPDTVAACLASADGVIVGTAIKHDARVDHPIDPARLAALLRAARRQTKQ